MSPNFFQLIHSTKECQCSDPRDKIYALLNLSPVFDNKPTPDYTKSKQEVFQEVVLKYEESFSDLNILTSIEIPYKQTLPSSWCRRIWKVLAYFGADRHYKATSWTPD
jgi:hypothetical protein